MPFPTIEHRRKAGSFQLNFVLTQFLSGHGKFGSYLTQFTRRDDPNCQCGNYQDPEHLIFDCPLLSDLRDAMFGQYAQQQIRIQFDLSSIGTLLADDFTREHFLSFLSSIHQRLVLWED